MKEKINQHFIKNSIENLKTVYYKTGDESLSNKKKLLIVY